MSGKTHRTTYKCCPHCEHDDTGFAPNLHRQPCPHGCNQAEEKAERNREARETAQEQDRK